MHKNNPNIDTYNLSFNFRRPAIKIAEMEIITFDLQMWNLGFNGSYTCV
jgi:hypothetical protein